MSNSIYYDGTKLLSLLDQDGQKPELYICTSNRTAGKTTYFASMLVRRYKRTGKKFALLQRFNYELDGIAEKFFRDIQALFFPDDEMTSKARAKGIYHDLFLNGDNCGYAISLNAADQIKKYSHYFSDVESIFFDEFQSENNHYCDNELRKFQSIHDSIARGRGKQTRYVPVYMTSNPVSILNPYYVALGISSRLTAKVKFLRGRGWVLEQGYNEAAAKAKESSAFHRAFEHDSYASYSSQGVYLNDNAAFISQPTGKSNYLATIRCKGKDFAIREYPTEGVLYCDDRPDRSYPSKISVTTDDHEINYVMLRSNSLFFAQLRFYFDRGAFRFKDLSCKDAILTALSY